MEDAAADGNGAPRWQELSRTVRFEWHDHRAHWMAKSTPPQERDESVRTKVLEWEIPITVGRERGAISGTLLWTPTAAGAAPLGLIFGIGGVVIAVCIVVIVVPRRRAEASVPATAW